MTCTRPVCVTYRCRHEIRCCASGRLHSQNYSAKAFVADPYGLLYRPWQRVSAFRRAQVQAYGRTYGNWTAQEDAGLLKGIGANGLENWPAVARFVPTRNSKSCRQRRAHGNSKFKRPARACTGGA